MPDISFDDITKKFDIPILNQNDKEFRAKIYFENLQIIKDHNDSNSSFKMGITRFSFLTERERIAFLGINFEGSNEIPKLNSDLEFERTSKLEDQKQDNIMILFGQDAKSEDKEFFEHLKDNIIGETEISDLINFEDIEIPD